VELRSARSILRFGKLGYCEHQVKMRNLLEAIRADTAESTNQSRLSAQRKLHTYLSSGGRGLYLAIAMAPKQ